MKSRAFKIALYLVRAALGTCLSIIMLLKAFDRLSLALSLGMCALTIFYWVRAADVVTSS